MWWMISVAWAGPPLTGTWKLAETSDAVEAKHSAAIDAAIAQLPWAFRPFARPRLTGAVSNCAQVRLRLDEQQFESHCDGKDPFRQGLGGEASTLTADDGKPYKAELKVTADRLHLEFTGEDGGQRFIYVPQADGTLLLTSEIFSPWLETPIGWTVRYRVE